MTEVIKRDVTLTAPQAEFILGALNCLLKDDKHGGLSVAAGVLHVASIIEGAFKDAVEAQDKTTKTTKTTKPAKAKKTAKTKKSK